MKKQNNIGTSLAAGILHLAGILFNSFILALCFHLFYDHYFSYAFNLPPLGIPCLFWGFLFFRFFIEMLHRVIAKKQ